MSDLKIALVISADKEIRERFARLLNKVGVSYILESDKTTGIIRLLELDVSLVIVDMSIVHVNGADFIRLIKRLRPRVRLIAITSSTDKEYHDQLIESGAMYCFVKSVKEIITENIVTELMRSSTEKEE
jgi:DNA-binding NarL/FixJ family response regulator